MGLALAVLVLVLAGAGAIVGGTLVIFGKGAALIAVGVCCLTAAVIIVRGAPVA